MYDKEDYRKKNNFTFNVINVICDDCCIVCIRFHQIVKHLIPAVSKRGGVGLGVVSR